MQAPTRLAMTLKICLGETCSAMAAWYLLPDPVKTWRYFECKRVFLTADNLQPRINMPFNLFYKHGNLSFSHLLKLQNSNPTSELPKQKRPVELCRSCSVAQCILPRHECLRHLYTLIYSRYGYLISARQCCCPTQSMHVNALWPHKKIQAEIKERPLLAPRSEGLNLIPRDVYHKVYLSECVLSESAPAADTRE